jgi:hypothetical protein
MKGKIILSLCDYSGAWAKPYKDAGYDVRLVDLKNGQDVRLLEWIDAPVHGILAAPPCTVFASSGARWPRAEKEMLEGLSVVDACLRIICMTKPVWWALENPIGKLRRYLGPPVMRFQPCQFGDPYTKATCLWGDFVPPRQLFSKQAMREVEPVLGSCMHTQFGGKSEKTKTLRSVTPAGFAQAFFEANP